jgi:hypothetical protein
MTDPRRIRRTTVRRSTYVLIDGLQKVGDFGQHLEGEIVPHGFGVAVCLTALQVVEQLTTDLQATSSREDAPASRGPTGSVPSHR